jgi:hypothetical protein
MMGKIGFGWAMVEALGFCILRNTVGGRYDPDFDAEIALRAGFNGVWRSARWLQPPSRADEAL